jgi:hypothetical protein
LTFRTQYFGGLFQPPITPAEPVGVGVVGQAGSQEFSDPQARLDLAQQQHATVQGDPAAIKTGNALLAMGR